MSVQFVRAFRPEVDGERCIRCGLCQTFCPEGTALLTERGVLFDLRYCKGCGICANECPVEAIKMVTEG